MIGETISHYRVLEKLGEGGMGIVYRAEDVRLGREVALKFLPGHLIQDREARQRFVQEARAASTLDHPNICTIHEIDETEDGRLFIAMARYQGETLREKLRDGAFPLEQVLDIGLQVALGLAEAHRRGIVHRDVKPENVFVTDSGTVKILDFGLARLAGASRITTAGTTVGTVVYMSPEQAQGKETDPRNDVWSLGVTLYEMTTGRRPFPGEHPQSVIRAILNDRPVPMTELRAGVPAELERIAAKALAKRAEDRYADMNELISDLRNLKGLVESSRATAVIPSKRSRRHYGIGVIAIVALVAALFFVLRGTPPEGGEVGEVIDSIAVLPLDNLTGDPEQLYFVDGMQEALITNLSRIAALRVISRTSTMRYRDTRSPMPEIARELGVDVLVEGSVFRSGERVRITAQLIHGPTDRHLWAQSYDRDLGDVLGLVSEVSRAIASEIELVLTPEEERRLAPTSPVSAEAHEAYLKGRYALNQLGKGIRESFAHFDEALAREPTFAPAHAWKAHAYFMLGFFGMEPWGEVVPRAREAALRALEIDDGLGEAHAAMGYVYLYFDWNWSAAEREFVRALELNPSDAFARHGYGDYLTVMGRPEEGARQVALGRDVDPMSPAAAAPVPFHLLFARRYREALREFDALVERFPRMASAARLSRADVLWHEGERDEALALYREIWKEDENLVEALDRGLAEGGPIAALGRAARELEGRSRTASVPAQRIAELYGKAQDPVRTLEWLDRALADRRPETLHLMANPAFDFLRSTDEFQAFRERIGLP